MEVWSIYDMIMKRFQEATYLGKEVSMYGSGITLILLVYSKQVLLETCIRRNVFEIDIDIYIIYKFNVTW